MFFRKHAAEETGRIDSFTATRDIVTKGGFIDRRDRIWILRKNLSLENNGEFLLATPNAGKLTLYFDVVIPRINRTTRGNRPFLFNGDKRFKELQDGGNVPAVRETVFLYDRPDNGDPAKNRKWTESYTEEDYPVLRIRIQDVTLLGVFARQGEDGETQTLRSDALTSSRGSTISRALVSASTDLLGDSPQVSRILRALQEKPVSTEKRTFFFSER